MFDTKPKTKPLFGGNSKWNASDWTASDDRVRGGKSQSYFDISGSTARFHGNLDIETLGGAGFASQRTATSTETWDLSQYGGLKLEFGQSDGKQYTFILKDTLLPKDPDTGREQSTISYEYDFTVFDGKKGHSIAVPWDKFIPTYRGKPKKDAPKLDTKTIRRFSIMMRSFFGDQKGDFSLTIKSISAISVSEDVEFGAGIKDNSDELRTSRGTVTGFSWRRVLALVGFSFVLAMFWHHCHGPV